MISHLQVAHGEPSFSRRTVTPGPGVISFIGGTTEPHLGIGLYRGHSLLTGNSEPRSISITDVFV